MTKDLREKIQEKMRKIKVYGTVVGVTGVDKVTDSILLLIRKELKKNMPKKFTEGSSFEVERNPYGEGQVSGRNGAISEVTKIIDKVLNPW